MMLKLPFNLKQNKDFEKFLTIDFDCDKVECLAFYAPKNEGEEISSITSIPSAKIIGIGIKRLEPGVVRGGYVVNAEALAEATKRAIEDATTNGEKIEHVIFGVSGNLSIESVTTARVAREVREKIAEKEFLELQSKITQSAFTQAQNEVMHSTGDSEAELELITSSNVYTKLDNRIIKSPIGMEADVIETAYFTAFTPTYHVRSLQTLAKKLGLTIIAIGSEMYCLMQTLLKAQASPTDSIIINIDTDFTEVAVVFGGGIVAKKHVDIGAVHFTNAISEQTGLSYIEAEKMKRTYAYGKLAPPEAGLVKAALKEPLQLWLEAVELLFSDFTGVKTFASQINLVGEAAELPDIKDLLQTNTWIKSIPFKADPQYKKVSLNDFKTVVDSTSTLGSLEQILTSALSIIYLQVKGMLND